MKKCLKDFLPTGSVNNERSNRFANTLCSSELYTHADTVLAYSSMTEESPTNDILLRCLFDGKKLALPKITNTTMDFLCIDPSRSLEHQLCKNSYGIAEPHNSAIHFAPESIFGDQFNTPQNILIIVPALAFTKQGIRLGRGAGFYDRYLAKILSLPPLSPTTTRKTPNNITLCGMCYHFQILPTLPREPHDVPMHYILTENELICCENK